MNIARRAVVLASLLAACPAATAQVEVAPPPHATLDDVVKEYLRLELPLPPKDAVLVRREHWFPKHLLCLNGIPEDEQRRNKLVCEFGFVNPNGAPRFFQGSGRDFPEDIDRSELKHPDTAPPVHAEGWHSDEGMAAMAVVCKLRGWHERAAEFHARAVASNLAREDGVTLLQNLRRIAFLDAATKLTERGTDRAAVFTRLTRLYGENADLRTDANRILLARLSTTVHFQRVAKPGSIHALIDDLTDYWEDPESKSEAGQEAYWKLVESGFDAVPELIKHAGDTRLTRSGSFIDGYTTVGQLCSRILFELSGRSIAGYTHKKGGFLEAKLAEDWFAEARRIGEEKWLLANVEAGIPPGESAYHIPTPHVARAIAIKYPASLPAVYRGALRKKTDERLKDFVNEVLISRLERKAKVALLEEGAASGSMEHRAYALNGLAKLDAPTFQKHLRATLMKLIADKGRGWDTLDYDLPPLLQSVADRECWLLLTTLAKSMSPYDRIMLLHHTDEPTDKPEPAAIRRLRIEFHLGFLHDDASDAVGKQGDVRDTAAHQLRTLFKIPRQPAEEYEVDNGPLSRFLLRALVLTKCRIELARLMQTGAPVPPLDAKEQVYYPTKKGTTWVHVTNDGEETRSTIAEVRESKSGHVIAIARLERGNPVVRWRIEASEKGLNQVELRDGKVVSSLCLLKLPLRVGDEWPVEQDEEELPKLKGTAKAVAVEWIDVPAGRFRAVEVLWDYKLDGEPMKRRYWYAPNVGLIKTEYPGGMLVLKSFNPMP